jgi:3-methyladenine DNA glycosylase AlkD
VDLALWLFRGKYTEGKLAAILFLQELLLPLVALGCPDNLCRFADLFDDAQIHDWSTCDWFCVTALGPVIQMHGVPCAAAISDWRTAENLWRARASVVPFITVASHTAYYPAIAESYAVLIRRPERFAKTAVWWVLRESSPHDGGFVRDVIEVSIQHFSSEALRNATKYLSTDVKHRYATMLRDV